jgi:hypothetical protein
MDISSLVVYFSWRYNGVEADLDHRAGGGARQATGDIGFVKGIRQAE